MQEVIAPPTLEAMGGAGEEEHGAAGLETPA